MARVTEIDPLWLAFVQAMVDEPRNPAPRAAAIDWLDEQGERFDLAPALRWCLRCRKHPWLFPHPRRPVWRWYSELVTWRHDRSDSALGLPFRPRLRSRLRRARHCHLPDWLL